MSRPTTMTVRLSGALSDFVAANVSETGSYENVSEYIRDLIRRDKERAEQEAFARLKAELRHAFAAPDST
jgi:putative addiction module CopG family antidote